MTATGVEGRTSAIDRRFAALRAEGRRALVCYVTAGHPDPERSVALLQGLEEAGADVIELGVPFSEPLADGPVIQRSSQVALDHGIDLDGALALLGRARLTVPVVLFSYLNPLLAAGREVLARAADAGASGILVTDLPVGADAEREAWLGGGPLDFVRLVAPTTPTPRMAEIARHGRGFVYLISRLGVTGEQDALSATLPESVARLRATTTLPICVGFGISRPDQAAAVARIADGVVVGSALVRAADEDVGRALSLARDLRAAIDGA
ncbi:tryptophan synthase subunit alpha [Roseisolibacter sp. H3M3-2]|uniref:tryptophan synthase subunit alpha n=1 Tax=Roseisolibacter sp. H3M3-2 TaxID=3031323 RepID=UPI0023DAB400|nr:tryptophan synthase subunit alpha [Roseisolibacter sp. H3M3-2]MDF1501534.1 tryptophan synthase subunit alpha [Roseisolibacter sp. H3M3-2]